jgi:hypothetical protein
LTTFLAASAPNEEFSMREPSNSRKDGDKKTAVGKGHVRDLDVGDGFITGPTVGVGMGWETMGMG